MTGFFFSCFSSVQSIPPEWNSATWPNQTAPTAEQPLTWWHRSTPSKAGEQDEGCLYCSFSEDLPWGAMAAGQAVAAPSRAEGPITAVKLLPLACCSQDLLPPRQQHKGALTSSLPLTGVMFQSSRGFSCGKKKYLLFPLRKFHSDPVNYYLNLTMFGGIFSLRIASWPQILCLDCTQKSSS